MQWPEDSTVLKISGVLTNSDLKCAGLVLPFLIMDEVCPWGALEVTHVALFSNNQSTVSWVERMASRGSRTSGQLLCIRAFCMREMRVSPLTTMHVAGTRNQMTDIPSRSFGSEPKWHFRTDADLARFSDKTFPRPHKNCWIMFRPSFAISTKMIFALRMRHFDLDEWRRLPRKGRSILTTGRSTSGLFNWSLTFRTPATLSRSEHSPALQPECDPMRTVVNERCELTQHLARSLPLARRSLWPEAPTRPN